MNQSSIQLIGHEKVRESGTLASRTSFLKMLEILTAYRVYFAV
jgi:hypothetical protein